MSKRQGKLDVTQIRADLLGSSRRRDWRENLGRSGTEASAEWSDEDGLSLWASEWFDNERPRGRERHTLVSLRAAPDGSLLECRGMLVPEDGDYEQALRVFADLGRRLPLLKGSSARGA